MFLYNSAVDEIVCGAHHTMFLCSSGQVYSCGNNDYGQLGHDGPRRKPGSRPEHSSLPWPYPTCAWEDLWSGWWNPKILRAEILPKWWDFADFVLATSQKPYFWLHFVKFHIFRLCSLPSRPSLFPTRLRGNLSATISFSLPSLMCGPNLCISKT